MNLTVLQENLLPRLQEASRFISSKAQLPILTGVHLIARDHKIIIQTTDLKVGFQTSLGGKIIEDGEVIVSAKVLTEILASLRPGAVELESIESGVKITQQKTQAKLPGFPLEDFPPFPELGTHVADIDGKTFSECIENNSFCASLDETRPVLASVLMKIEGDRCTFVATDGYRLAVIERECENSVEPLTLLVPAKTLSEVGRTMDKEKVEKVRIFSSKELAQVSFVADDTSIIVRETEGTFPNYTSIIPQSFALMIQIDRDHLIQALKTALVIAKESSSIVSFKIEKGKIVLSGVSASVGSNEIEVETDYKGGTVKTIACNAKFLLDSLLRISKDRIELHVNEELKPILIRPQGDERYTYLVMPFKK